MQYSHATEDVIGFQAFKVTDTEKNHQAVVRVILTREGTAYLIAFVDDINGDHLPETDFEVGLTLAQAFDLISEITDPFTFVDYLKFNIRSLAE